jgi:hypothetical protein
MADGNAQPSTDVSIAASDEDEAARAFVLGAVPWAASDPAPLVTWPGATTRDAVEREAVSPSAHLGEVFRRMRHDPRLGDAAQRSRRDARVAATDDDRLDRARFVPLARDAHGTVLLWGAMRNAQAVLILDARPRDPLALWSLRVADDASRSVDGWPAADGPWTRDQIKAAQRAPGTVGSMRLPAGLDTRWWWLGALVLVLVEGVVRRERRGAPS